MSVGFALGTARPVPVGAGLAVSGSVLDGVENALEFREEPIVSELPLHHRKSPPKPFEPIIRSDAILRTAEDEPEVGAITGGEGKGTGHQLVA